MNMPSGGFVPILHAVDIICNLFIMHILQTILVENETFFRLLRLSQQMAFIWQKKNIFGIFWSQLDFFS